MKITITDCTFSENDAGGIYLAEGIQAKVSGGQIISNGGNGIHIEGNGDGIEIERVLIEKNEKYGVIVMPPPHKLEEIGFLPSTPNEVVLDAISALRQHKDAPATEKVKVLKKLNIEKYLTHTAEIATIAAFFMPYV